MSIFAEQTVQGYSFQNPILFPSKIPSLWEGDIYSD
jgi:hypothetical protein